MRPAIAIAVIGGLAFMPSAASLSNPHHTDGTREEELPEVTVVLIAPSHLTKGIGQREEMHAGTVGAVDLSRPHRLTVRLPDGRSLTMSVQYTSLTIRRGIVTGVLARRLLQPVRFKEAVADLRLTMRELKIEPGNPMKRQMAAWPEDMPDLGKGSLPYEFRTWTPVNQEVSLDVAVGPAHKGGWYYTMGFNASFEACEAAQAAMRLVTLPDGVRQHQGQVQPGLKAEMPPPVSVPLLGSVRDIKGMELHPVVPEIRCTSHDLLRPHRLTLKLPDGRSIALDTLALTFLCRYGIIEEIYMRSPSQSASYKEVVADIRHELEALGIEPDERMRGQMAAWPEDASDVSIDGETPDFRSETRVSEQVRLEVRVSRDARGAWFSLLMFRATDEARRAAQAAAGKPLDED